MEENNKSRTAIRVVLSIFLTLLLVGFIAAVVYFGNNGRGRNGDRNRDYDAFFNTSEPVSSEEHAFDGGSSESYAASEISSSGNYSNGRREVVLKSDEEMELPEVSEYDIDLAFGKVTILPTESDTPYIFVNGDRDVSVTVLKRDYSCELRVDLPGYNRLHSLEDIGKGIEIEIYLPQKTKELDFNLSAGLLLAKKLASDSFSLTVDAGSAEVRDCVFREIDTEMNAGNITLYADEKTKSIDSQVFAGNMKLLLDDMISGYRVEYESTFGNFSDKTGLSNSDASKGFVGSKEGILTYGDKSVIIELEVNAGNLSMETYTK